MDGTEATPIDADGSARVVHGDALALPITDGSVDLIVTSPPYFGLRSYQDGGEHYAGQIGAEATPAEFVDALIAATAEMARVLKPSGSIWVNLGDKYADKALLGLPWRYANRVVDDLGLTLRAEVVWEKPKAPMQKVADRVRRTHETWFHFTTRGDYFSDLDAIREEPTSNYHDRPQFKRAMQLFEGAGFTDAHMRAVRSVGIIDTGGGAVRSGGSWQSESGQLAAEVRAVLRSYYRELCGSNTDAPRGKVPGSVWRIPTQSLKIPAHLGIEHFAAFPVEWPRRLILGWSPVGGVVLDPMGGTGTTALAAKALGRHGISVDMSADYCRLAEWRTADPKQLERAA